MHEQQDAGTLDELVVGARALDAPVLEAWARGLVALAGVRAGEPDGRDEALSAASVARNLGVGGARLIAHLAVAEASTDPVEEEEHRSEAAALARETGLRAPGGFASASNRAAAQDVDAIAAPLAIRLLGGFELDLAGEAADLSVIRPRARMLLRLLALNAGRRVHHESIELALWPDADATSSARNLHVAVSALRRILEPAQMRGSFQLIRREGDAYVMTVPDGSFIDLIAFDQALAAGHRARAAGDSGAAERHFTWALRCIGAICCPKTVRPTGSPNDATHVAWPQSMRHRPLLSCFWSGARRLWQRAYARQACASSAITIRSGDC